MTVDKFADLDLDGQKEGEWFYYFTSHISQTTGEIVYDDPVDYAKVKIRSMAPFIESRLSSRKKQVEHVVNPKTRAMERIEYFPELSIDEIKAEREDTYDYVIQGLKGFRDRRTKKEIKCTRENKIKLMKIPVFDRFIARCLQLLSDSTVQIEEQAAKNLSSGSSSQTSKPDSE